MLPKGLPEYTLGWGVAEWCSQNLIQPDGDHKGDPWVFKPDQMHFILWFYAVDEHGDWLYNEAYRERAKGTGKTPMVAALACVEFLGPVKFSHFDPAVLGGVVGKRNPDSSVQIAAVSEKQCKNIFSMCMEMLGEIADVYGIEVGMTKIHMVGAGPTRVIEMITANFRSQEGFRPTFAIFEETQHWLPNERGPDFADTVRRNLKKKSGRAVQVTNAPVPGEGSVAELTHKEYQMFLDGEAENNTLFDSFSIHIEDMNDPVEVLAGLEVMYKDAPWQNLRTLLKTIMSPSTKELDNRRFYFNETKPPHAMWLTQDEWRGAREPDLRLKKSDRIALGFKLRRHCAAIVATRLRDNAIFLLDLWERPRDARKDWEVPYGEVDIRMRQILKKHDVFYILSSPEGFQDVVGRWGIDHPDIFNEAIWLSRNKQKHADAVDLFEKAVRDRRLVHNDHPDLERHVMKCFVDVVPQGDILREEFEGTTNYIEAAQAAILSFKAAQLAIEEGGLEEDADNYVFSF